MRNQSGQKPECRCKRLHLGGCNGIGPRLNQDGGLKQETKPSGNGASGHKTSRLRLATILIPTARLLWTRQNPAPDCSWSRICRDLISFYQHFLGVPWIITRAKVWKPLIAARPSALAYLAEKKYERALAWPMGGIPHTRPFDISDPRVNQGVAIIPVQAS